MYCTQHDGCSPSPPPVHGDAEQKWNFLMDDHKLLRCIVFGKIIQTIGIFYMMMRTRYSKFLAFVSSESRECRYRYVCTQLDTDDWMNMCQ